MALYDGQNRGAEANRFGKNSLRAGLILIVAGMLVGCSKKESQPQPVVQPPPSPGKPIESILTSSPGEQPPPPPSQPSIAAEKSTTATTTTTTEAAPSSDPGIAELNSALSVWVFKHNNPPKDLGELVKAGLLKKVPTPPPGKRYVVNPLTMSAHLE